MQHSYRHDSRYIGAKAWLLGKSIVNVDFLLKICDEIDPLDKERLTSPDRHFVAVATNCLNGNTEYYDANNCSNILTAIKASATMPYISPMIDVDGTPCLDGGCSCTIPYQWALDEGFEEVFGRVRYGSRDFMRVGISKRNKKCLDDYAMHII